MSKYHNKPCEADGYKFDSLAERSRWHELQLLSRAGAIGAVTVHPVYVLQEAYRHGGRMVRAINYEGDFCYREDGVLVVEDVKGVITQVFSIKRKLFEFRYPDVELRIIR
jgi:hypothetical protein